MLEDSYLCECNIEVAQSLKDQCCRTICADLTTRSRVLREGFMIARYNDVILYNSIMMLTHGGFNYAE